MNDARSRGPLRPERLVSVRARQSRRLRAHQFRAIDVALISVSVLVSVSASSPSPLLQTPIVEALPFLLGGMLLSRMLRSLALYRFGRSESLQAHLTRLLLTTAATGAVVILTNSLAGRLVDGHRAHNAAVLKWLGITAVGLVVLHICWSLLVGHWRRHGLLTPNVVIVGATVHAEQLIANTIEHRDLNVLGVFDDRLARSPTDVLGVPVLGSSEALLTHKITPFVDLIVVAVDPSASARVREITSRLASLPNEVTLLVDQGDAQAQAAALRRLADAPLAPLTGTVDTDRRVHAKRMQDLVIGLPVLLLTAPLLALIAVAVRLDSGGPVLFRQRRHGFNNEAIVVWKFRTMRHESADARAELQVTADDQRVTRVGRILRKSSLDELPQLINVVRGEMSLVGPRPHAIGMKTGEIESSQLVAEYAHRHRIKPGMTGWAAVQGSRGPLHHADEVRQRVVLDVDYIKRQSFWLDLQIMLRTVPSMLGDRTSVR